MHRMTFLFLLAVIAAGLSAPGVVAAADTAATERPSEQANPHGTITVISDNDLYGPHNKDRHYTNGIRFGWMSDDDDVPGWARSFQDVLPLLAPDGRHRIGWTFGQDIFTPEDKQTETPILDDRPYAAWLYAGLKLQTETDARLDTIEFDLGVVGPLALGEEVQSRWHSLIGAKPAHGWNNQIKNEPGLDIRAERSWRYPLTDTSDEFGVDVVPNLTASLGNVFTYGGGGATIRFGRALGSDFGPPRIDPATPGSDSFRPPDGLGWYLFAGFEGRAVARNIFLDGNTFAHSQTVDKRPLVGDLQAGIALTLAHARLTFTELVRSKEFYGQHHPDYVGAIALSVGF